ncbi:MAG TPA: sulfatase-like hydrolase/transferase [Thermoanaerobaculia bacterium]|nr:sulfatase-like hydrolase/transferase [Thermoanaerobaculia bacterium]
MKKRVTLAALCLVFLAIAPADAEDRRALPNVVLFLADDVGYGDVGVYGGVVPTPNIDRLAREGMRFTDAHSPAALCAPSRFSLLTGSNPYRNGRPGGSWDINFSSGFTTGAAHLREGRHLTAGEILQRAGYRTAFLGKGHLGGDIYDTNGKVIREKDAISTMDFARGIRDSLSEHGFDYSLLLPSGIQHEPYAFFENGRYLPVDPASPPDNRSTVLRKNGRYEITNNGVCEIVEAEKVPARCDVHYDSSQVGRILTAKGLQFIDDHLALNRREKRDRPFLLYFSSQAIHVPHTPPIDFDGDPKVLDRPVKGRTGGRTSDVLYELDLQLGDIVAKLRKEGLLENTIIIFTSDNGALWPNVVEYGDPRHDNNGPFRDYKASVYEGGHRVPFIVRWGDGTAAGSKVAPGTVSDQLIVNHDWVATMYELTGQTMAADQAMDSASLLPILTGTQKGPLHEFVIYQAGFAYDGAIREGSMVLLVDRDNKATELYDLSTDIAQERNLIADAKYRDEVARLRAKFLQYNDHDNTTFHEPRTTPPVVGTR